MEIMHDLYASFKASPVKTVKVILIAVFTMCAVGIATYSTLTIFFNFVNGTLF